jgi:hypothetical protein
VDKKVKEHVTNESDYVKHTNSTEAAQTVAMTALIDPPPMPALVFPYNYLWSILSNTQHVLLAKPKTTNSCAYKNG